jgi:hypothetical protein
MSKFKFIQNLLENEKFDLSQKERFFKLVSKELEHSSEVNIKGIKKDIEDIKKKIGLVDKFEDSLEVELEDKEADLSIKYEWIPSYIDPIGIYKYLFDYNNNLILKSTCHKIDSNELKIINEHCSTDAYDFNKHLSKIIEAFEVHDKKYAPAFIKSFIRLYLTGKDFYGNNIGAKIKNNKLGWTEDKIVFSWSDEKLKKWADKNSEMPPCPSDGLAKKQKNLGFEFDNVIKNSYSRNISTFSKLVLHFKKMFHVKSDNSLKSIIIQENIIKGWDGRIEFVIADEDFPLIIELFTYVERVIQAYNKLIELILEKAIEIPKVKLTLKEDESAVYFTMHHLNNQFAKSAIGIEERLHGQTYKNIIINQINGLCDLFVQADLGQNKFVSFNIWDENYNKKALNNNQNPINIITSETPIQGVAHIMRFKKK